MKGFKFYPTCKQVNLLFSWRLADDMRLLDQGQRNLLLIMQQTAMDRFVLVPHSPSPTKGDTGRPRWVPTCAVDCVIRKEPWAWGESTLLVNSKQTGSRKEILPPLPRLLTSKRTLRFGPEVARVFALTRRTCRDGLTACGQLPLPTLIPQHYTQNPGH